MIILKHFYRNVVQRLHSIILVSILYLEKLRMHKYNFFYNTHERKIPNLIMSFLGGNTFRTESYEQLNDVRFEGFNLNTNTSNELVQIHSPAKLEIL